ncbi:MAG: glycosyltransferase [Deltaproteobacteria bacterium]|nr:glycosyltransferase [Deltaproteobacteria bacterium]
MENRLCLIIPTKDHPEILGRFLESVRRQTVKPGLLLLVDGGDRTIEHLLGRFPDLSFQYLRVYPPGLCKQRNAGIRAVPPEYNLVGFFDDDYVLFDDAIEKMMGFWSRQNGRVGGASFNTMDSGCMPHDRRLFLRRLFGLSRGRGGDILPSGIGTAQYPCEKTYRSQWLSGGSTVWRRPVLAKFSFDEWFAKHGVLDDLDFCWRANKEYELYVVAQARVFHRQLSKREFAAGKITVVNNFYFVSKHPGFSKPKLIWAYLGKILFQLFSFLKTGRTDPLKRAAGYLAGFRCGMGRKIAKFDQHVS